MRFIEKLQNKPRYVRIQVLWISVILVMVIIFSLWVVYLKSSLERGEEQKVEAEKQSVPSLFSTLKEDFSILKEKLRAGVGNLKSNAEREPKFKVEIIK